MLSCRSAAYTSNYLSGFTLVEMLVSTALVVLIMSLFAQIYSSAISTITEQRGMANNDQKARVLTKIIHNDFKQITYKQISDPDKGNVAGLVPLTPDDSNTDSIDLDSQSGYFYVSENDPYNDADDVLQFTVEVPGTDDPFVGRAPLLTSGIVSSIPYQPYYTDAGPALGTAESSVAEISYFLRKGTLYRRVLLLRAPPFHKPAYPEQPGNATEDLFTGPDRENYTLPLVNTSNSFWHDFDFAATRKFYDQSDSLPPSGRTSYLYFHGKSSLSNDPLVSNTISIALPWNRFGHLNDQRTAGSTANHGMPREFMLSDSGDRYFIGRLTHLETSSAAMDFPGIETLASYQIFNRSNTTITYDPDNGVVNGLTNGDRLGEDILLTNVESFDVQVWDPKSVDFVQLGLGLTFDSSSGAPGVANRTNANYGPSTTPADNHVFDTWHPKAGAAPPYFPLITNISAMKTWAASTPFNVGDIIPVPSLTYHKFVYQAVRTTTGGTSGVTGTYATPVDGPLLPALLGNEFTDNQIVWRCIENRRGLQSIRMVIRYVDVQSRIPRQVTIVHSFAK